MNTFGADGNMYALNQYERRLERFDRLESAFEQEISDELSKIQKLAESIKHIAMNYEDEHGLAFDWNEYINSAISDIA